MASGKKRNLSGYVLVVPFVSKDILNGLFTDIKAKVIGDLAKGCVTLFSSSSHYITFVGLCKLWRTPKAWQVFCRSSGFVFFHDATSGIFIDKIAPSSFGNRFFYIDSPNELIFGIGR